MAEWIIVGLTASGLVVSLVAVLIRVSIALSKNTDATDRLTIVIDKQEARIEDHEKRIYVLEDRAMNRRASDRGTD